jgi:hypothetical protein
MYVGSFSLRAVAYVVVYGKSNNRHMVVLHCISHTETVIVSNAMARNEYAYCQG